MAKNRKEPLSPQAAAWLQKAPADQRQVDDRQVIDEEAVQKTAKLKGAITEAKEGKKLGTDYKSLFISNAKGFELGVDSSQLPDLEYSFVFTNEPDARIRATLSRRGFQYIPDEEGKKMIWKIPGKTDGIDNRKLCDALANNMNRGERVR